MVDGNAALLLASIPGEAFVAIALGVLILTGRAWATWHTRREEMRREAIVDTLSLWNCPACRQPLG